MNQEIPEMRLVDSSNIESIGYDHDQNMLYVLFRHGGLYRYLNVLEHVFTDFMNAGSKGQYFHNKIKASYSYERL